LQVTFEGIVGSSYTGDIAIDGVQIIKGNCPGKLEGCTLGSKDIVDISIMQEKRQEVGGGAPILRSTSHPVPKRLLQRSFEIPLAWLCPKYNILQDCKGQCSKISSYSLFSFLVGLIYTCSIFYKGIKRNLDL